MASGRNKKHADVQAGRPGLLRKLLCTALALLLLSGAAACTEKINPVRDGIEGGMDADRFGTLPAAERARRLLPEKLVKIGFVQAGHESDWRIAATRACRQAFSEENGYALYFFDADNSLPAQVEAVRSFIRERVDYLVITPAASSGWDAVLTEAYHAGIPVILLERLADCQERYYLAWFGSDFELEGQYAGRWLQSYLSKCGRGREEINIVTINGTEGALAQVGRTQGFAVYLEKNKNWKLLAQESGDFTENGGRQVMERYLETYPDIDVVVCQNDKEAAGACAALDEAGVPYGKAGGIIVISFDAAKAGLEAVLEGKIHADFECSPLAPLYAEEAVRKLEAGETLEEKKYYLPEECFTFEEEPRTLFLPSGMKKMTTVTRSLIKSRLY